MTGATSQTVLALPGRVATSSLQLPETLSLDEWLEVGRRLASAGHSLQWWVGDWLRFGKTHHGEKYKDALGTLGYSYQTLRNLAWVAGRFELSRRRDNLSWGHHEEVAGLEPAEADALLDEAESKSWSVRMLRRAVCRRKNTVGCLPGSETCTVEDLEALILDGCRFRTIYADPPWQYTNRASRGAAEDHYPTMSVDELCELPVAKLADECCHLHLWTTSAFLLELGPVLDAWGFDYKCPFVWVKPQMGLGNFWRSSVEFLLLGVRGGLPFADRSQRNWIKLDRLRHSEKPEEIRRIIESVSPAPRLELFGRRRVLGWTVWGNEVLANEAGAEVAR